MYGTGLFSATADMNAMDSHPKPDPATIFTQLQKAAHQAQEQFARASGLSDFGASEASFQYLDRFIADYVSSERVKPELSRVYHQAISSFVGACVIQRYGGKWMLNKTCYVERLGPDGMARQAHPFTVVGMAMQGKALEPLHDWFFRRLAQEYAEPETLQLQPRVAPAAPAVNGVGELPAAMLQQIKASADQVMREHDLVLFGYAPAAVACLEHYLDQTAGVARTAALQDKLVNELGAFLGECAIAVYGGNWQLKPDGKRCIVALNEGQPVVLDPFGMVARRLKSSGGDDLHVWFTQTLPLVLLPASARMMMLSDSPPRRSLLSRLMDMVGRS